LKALLVNSPAYTWIRAFDQNRNGKQAWFALISHYKGTNEQNCIKDATYATIQNATYTGECHNWTFDITTTSIKMHIMTWRLMVSIHQKTKRSQISYAGYPTRNVQLQKQ
jgi:hypothetical protein